jgi:hypothetical protein
MPPPAIYSKVAAIAKREFKIDNLSGSGSATERFQLQRTIREIGSPIDYDRFSDTFVRLYWLRNYWKAVYFFEYEYVHKKFVPQGLGPPSVTVVSLGAGSASDTAACMAWLNEHLPLGSSVSLELVDESENQMRLARRLVRALVPTLVKVRWNVRFVVKELNRWRPASHAADIILMSHVLTENQDQFRMICNKTIEALKYKGDIVIIERERDQTWRHAIRYFTNAAVSVYDARINRKEKYLHNVLQSHDIPITPHYIKATTAPFQYQSDLIVDYFRAWGRQSVPLLKRIFASDAQFDEKPGIEQTIDGIAGIVEYWKEFPLRQSNIHLNIRNVANEDNLAICAFEGEFDKTKEHVAIRGAMNFYIDPYTKRIQKLVEYFGTEKTPHARSRT